MTNNIYQGVITALITPFKEGKIDLNALEKIIHLQIEAGINGIVVGGSTGEGSCLGQQDYYSLIRSSLQFADSKILVIAGMTAASTDEAITKVEELNKIGAGGIMCTAPHYVKPTQDGLFIHFSKIHEAAKSLIMLYSHPGRTGIDLSDETIIKLASLDRIIALKDAGSDIERPLRLQAKLPGFNLLGGDDSVTLAYNAHGGAGVVSVAANIVPRKCLEIQERWQNSDVIGALRLQQNLLPLYDALFSESNPIGIKYAASALGLCQNELKLPLMSAAEVTRDKIKTALMNLGLNLLKN